MAGKRAWSEWADRTLIVAQSIAAREAKESDAMIVRQWHGWTSKADADVYEKLFRTKGPKVEGRRGSYLLRRDCGDQVEFIVMHIHDSMDAIKAVFGSDYEVARFLPGAKRILVKYDETVAHYEIVEAPPHL